MEDKILKILKKRNDPQIHGLRPVPTSLELLKECPRCFTIVKGEFNFCIYCGVKLRIRSNSKDMEKTIVKKLTSKQNLKTQKLSFCNECGALMFSDKVNYKLVMKYYNPLVI